MNDWSYNPDKRQLEYLHGFINKWTGKPEHYVTVGKLDGIPHLVVRGVVPAGYDNVDYEERYPLELVEQLIRDSRNANTPQKLCT